MGETVMRSAPKTFNFYEIQRRQRWKSLLVFAALMLFYFFAIGLIVLAALVTIGAFSVGVDLLSGHNLGKFAVGVLALSLLVAAFHYWDARRFGAGYILKRLDARPPDYSDRYHKQYADTVEEIRIAAGLPRVKPYVIPAFSVNSMALVEPGGEPAVCVTEGLLADCTRDELQAAAAHELAHIVRGDGFYVTLVCSLGNFLERIQAALEPEDIPPEERGAEGRGGVPPVFVYAAVALSSFVMHLFSALLSRERETLADAAASELSRNPAALARALYKAHLKNSFVGDFSLTYSPMFIVAPKLSSGEEEGFFSRIFNSHPPVMRRIRTLARMSGLAPANIIEQVWEGQKLRERARGVLYSFAELRPGSEGDALSDMKSAPEAAPESRKAWLIQDRGRIWRGPFSLEELIVLPYFSLLKPVKNLWEGVQAQAREFPQIIQGIKNLGKSKPVNPARQNRCPRCRVLLIDGFYEGVEIKSCGKCGGKLVQAAKVDRILLRREFAFSEPLRSKARAFKEQFLLNPLKKQRSKEQEGKSLFCPRCGQRMVARPYNYQYFIPVDKCLACYHVWFDADELEILQIMVQKEA